MQLDANVPAPGSERGAWAIALALGAIGIAVLALVLSGVIGRVSSRAATPPPVIALTPTPVAHPAAPVSYGTPAGRPAIVGDPSAARARREEAVYEAQTSTHISLAWISGFYPIYAVAQKTFGVNWLLIASIHRQESAFSTDADDLLAGSTSPTAAAGRCSST